MKLHLRVLSGLQVGDRRSIEPPGGRIGREEGCAVHLRDESISRSHMELRYQKDRWWAIQHSVRSPSLVDGVLVGSNPLALRNSGVLQVGSVTLEYSSERTAAVHDLPESPPTMINVRRQLPTIQSAVLPQMTPLRTIEPPASEAPPTLILRRPPAAPVPASETPPPLDSPPTLITRPAGPAIPPPIAPVVREPPVADPLRQVAKERDILRGERDRLAAELVQMSQELKALRAAKAPHPVAAPPVPSNLAAQALKLLQPFGDSLEQAASALQDGDAARARALLREASFGLADLRDLFEPAGA